MTRRPLTVPDYPAWICGDCGDMRVRDQIAMLRNDSATDAERAAARYAAAWVAWAADATEAAWAAADAAAWAASAAQERQLRKMLTEVL